jgi:hypothetical protein
MATKKIAAVAVFVGVMVETLRYGKRRLPKFYTVFSVESTEYPNRGCNNQL